MLTGELHALVGCMNRPLNRENNMAALFEVIYYLLVLIENQTNRMTCGLNLDLQRFGWCLM